ncbi:hypothetical protein QUC26_09360 [Pseudomonas asiatica]|uniref:hypothetical protein n=1 Tax=Pseudomonas asiatica TaxID=2219225 RepID=UPI0025A0A044|nr:hypothetical protein [Pseudomonas asiatica]WJM55336.1 hypothetical protein QUC26_09360 [Pseudomonas asiatica]
MFPITIDGIQFPCFFETQGEANAAAFAYFEALGKNNYKFNILKGTTSNGCKYFVVKDSKGKALPLVREVL